MNKHAHELSQTILVAMALLLTAVWAGAAPVPVTALSLPDGYSGSEGLAINNTGQVAGYCTTEDGYWRACIWNDGACTIIDTADGVLDDSFGSESCGINASGQVIGACYDGYDNDYGFIWQDGVMTALGALPGYDFSYPNAINDAGQVVGSCLDMNGDFAGGFIWENGVMTPLVWTGVDRDGNTAQFPIDPNDINAAGQVVGSVRDPLNLLDDEPTVLWDDGVVTVLTPGETTYSGQINNNGWVICNMPDGNPWLYVPGTGLRSLNISAQYPDGEMQWASIAWPRGINDLNQVLIYSQDNSYRQRLWLWEDDGSADGSLTEIPLSSLLAPGEYTGYVYSSLNNAGQVAGHYQVQGSNTKHPAFFWDSATPDAIAALAIPPDDTNGVVNALNDAGVVTGDLYSSMQGFRPCTWDSAATPANQAPIANAGSDQTVSTFESSPLVQLSGAGSSDPDGDVCRYTWSEDGLPIATGIRPSVTLTRGVHVVTLTVTDSYGASSSDTVTITVSMPPSVFAVTVTSVVRKGKSITVTAEISNAQTTAATDVTVTEATLDELNTTSRLPLAVRTIRANSSKQCTLKFDSAAVAAGSASFWIYGTSSQGNFYVQVPVTVP